MVEHEPAHHQAAREQREHVEVEVERARLEGGALREPAGLRELQLPHAQTHRRPERNRDALEAHLARERARELRLDQRAGAGGREEQDECHPCRCDQPEKSQRDPEQPAAGGFLAVGGGGGHRAGFCHNAQKLAGVGAERRSRRRWSPTPERK